LTIHQYIVSGCSFGPETKNPSLLIHIFWTKTNKRLQNKPYRPPKTRNPPNNLHNHYQPDPNSLASFNTYLVDPPTHQPNRRRKPTDKSRQMAPPSKTPAAKG
jgi:hypothetical protein